MDTRQILRKYSQILARLSDSELIELINTSHEVKVSSGDLFISSGKPIDNVCIVLEGMITSVLSGERSEEKVLEHIGIGQTLGEAELQDENSFQSDYRAIEDSLLLCIPLKHYMQIVTGNVDSMQCLTEQSRTKSSRLLVSQYLNNLFDATKRTINDPELRYQVEQEWIDFEDNVLNDLKENIEWTTLRRGEYLFRKGDKGDGAYILASGVMGVTIFSQDEKEREIARITHGEIIGELALVTGEKRSANVVALRDCELFKLPSAEFQYIADKYPRMMLNVYRTISERFMQSRTNQQYRPRKSNIAIFNSASNASTEKFVKEFYASFSKLDTSEVLTRESVDKQIGKVGISNIARTEPANICLMHWLNSRESKSRFVLYQADSEWSEWTWRCTSQADQIIIMADVNNPPDFTEFKKNVQETGQAWHLVLVHPENTDRPRNTAHWLKESGAEQVYHVRQQSSGDIERLTRILAGRALSLVLGGGGARGFAHIGVLRALDELGVKIDMVGGTSIGAPIACLVAQQKSPVEIKTLAGKAFDKLIDFTIPFTSMIQGKRISRSIEKHTADWDIEDFWIPFFCISTNLTHARQVIHQSGNSARACRASFSIPGVLPPLPENKDLLVDGGVLNNLPIDVMRNLNPSGMVMAIDVVPPNGSRAKQNYGTYLSGWKQLFRLLNPFKKPIKAPAIGAVIMQSMVLGSSIAREQALKKGMADYYQNIHLKGVGLLDFDKVDYAEKIGYEMSLQPIKDWLESDNILMDLN